MSNLDLAPAIEAAELALLGDHCDCEDGEPCTCSNWDREAQLAVEAAAPIIARAAAVKALRDFRDSLIGEKGYTVADALLVSQLSKLANAIASGAVEP